MTDSQDVKPTRILELSNSIFEPLAFLGGIKLDLFSTLANGPLTAAELGLRLNIRPTRLELLLYALTATGLLDLDDGRFGNTPEAQTYLVKKSPKYMGYTHALFDELWHSAFSTSETLRQKTPLAKHDYATMSKQELQSYYRASLPAALASATQLLRLVDLSEAESIIDVGGGSGGLLVGLCQQIPTLRGTLVDHPNTCEIAGEIISSFHMAERIVTTACDVTVDQPPGQYDLAIMRNFIQVQSREQAGSAIRNIANTISPGGGLVIWGWVVDDNHLTPKEAALHNLVYLNFYDEGQAHTESDHRQWLGDAGLSDFRRTYLPGGPSLIVASKPAEKIF